MISLLSAGKDVLLILTLKWVNSCRSQSEASKGDAAMRSLIALPVPLPRVEESCDAAAVARLLRALLAERVGMKGKNVGAGCVERAGRAAPRPRSRPRPLPRGVTVDRTNNSSLGWIAIGVRVLMIVVLLWCCDVMFVVMSD